MTAPTYGDLDRLRVLGLSLFAFRGILALIQVASPLNVGHHEETQSHEHNQGSHDLQGQESTDLGLLVGSVCLIQRFLLPVWATARDPDA